MPHMEASIIIHAPWTQVAEVYRDYRGWPHKQDRPDCTL